MQNQQATRVVVLISPNSTLAKAAPSHDRVIQDAFANLKLSPINVPHTYLLNQIWDIVNVFVIDLYHAKYDFATAHIKEDLPVIFVNYSRRKVYVSVASRTRRDQINRDVAMMHEVNGWDERPPFVEDHTMGKVPCYPNPRSMIRSDRAVDPKAQEPVRSEALTAPGEGDT